MRKLMFAVHQIQDANGTYLNEVFEPAAADLEAFERVGAVREPTEEELAFYQLANAPAAKAPAPKKPAAGAADDEIK